MESGRTVDHNTATDHATTDLGSPTDSAVADRISSGATYTIIDHVTAGVADIATDVPTDIATDIATGIAKARHVAGVFRATSALAGSHQRREQR